MYSVVLQSGHVGDVVLVGSILCLYCCKNGDLPVRSCANVLLVFRGSVCSSLLMSSAICLMILLMYVLTLWCVSVFEMLLDCVFCVLIVVYNYQVLLG